MILIVAQDVPFEFRTKPSGVVVSEVAMKKVVLNFPTFGFVVGTRAMLGAGIGLLLSDRVPADRRRQIALTLIGIGAATTCRRYRSRAWMRSARRFMSF